MQTVKDLIQDLSKFPPAMPIALSVYKHLWASPMHRTSHGPYTVEEILLKYSGGETEKVVVIKVGG